MSSFFNCIHAQKKHSLYVNAFFVFVPVLKIVFFEILFVSILGVKAEPIYFCSFLIFEK